MRLLAWNPGWDSCDDSGYDSVSGKRMPIPDYQSLMLPVLKVLADRKEHSVAEARKHIATSKATPEESLERSFQVLRDALANEVLEAIKNGTPAAFERIVVDLLVAMGYGGSVEDAGSVVGKSGDGGIDGIIKQDKLG